MAEADRQDRSLAYLYTSSLHWSLTQFTPASMEVAALKIYRSTSLKVVPTSSTGGRQAVLQVEVLMAQQ